METPGVLRADNIEDVLMIKLTTVILCRLMAILLGWFYRGWRWLLFLAVVFTEIKVECEAWQRAWLVLCESDRI